MAWNCVKCTFTNNLTDRKCALCGTPKSLDVVPELGQKISINRSDMEIDSKDVSFDESKDILGSGSYAMVVRGRWQGQIVAVKLFKTQFTAKTVQHFWKEVSIMWQLRHPNIVAIHGACQEPNKTLIVMELLGQSLASFLRVVPSPPWSVRLKVLTQIARGLAFLHSKKIIHRDLKSLNVLLSREEKGKQTVAKLCDFGLAALKLETETLTLKSTRIVEGSTNWLAPELFRGVRPSFASDVYAFGAVCAEIVSCAFPFPDFSAAVIPELLKNNDVDLCDAVFSEDEKESLLQNCPDGFADEVLRRCLQRDPARRPEMKEIVETLTRISESAGVDLNSIEPAQALENKNESVFASSMPSLPSYSTIATNSLPLSMPRRGSLPPEYVTRSRVTKDEWNCTACTYLNAASATTCDICSAVRTTRNSMIPATRAPSVAEAEVENMAKELERLKLQEEKKKSEEAVKEQLALEKARQQQLARTKEKEQQLREQQREQQQREQQQQREREQRERERVQQEQQRQWEQQEEEREWEQQQREREREQQQRAREREQQERARQQERAAREREQQERARQQERAAREREQQERAAREREQQERARRQASSRNQFGDMDSGARSVKQLVFDIKLQQMLLRRICVCAQTFTHQRTVRYKYIFRYPAGPDVYISDGLNRTVF